MTESKSFNLIKTNLERAIAVHAKIPEFEPDYITNSYDSKGISNKSPYIIVCQAGNEDIGYMIGYDTADSMYIWLNGTVPEWRRRGVFDLMLDDLSHEATQRGHRDITVKSYNRFGSMLKALKSSGFIEVKTEGDAIHFVKHLREKVT